MARERLRVNQAHSCELEDLDPEALAVERATDRLMVGVDHGAPAGCAVVLARVGPDGLVELVEQAGQHG